MGYLGALAQEAGSDACSRTSPAVVACQLCRELDASAACVHREEPLTDAGVANLAGMTQMEVLNLAGHHLLTSEGLWFIGGMPNLRHLDLTGDMRQVPLFGYAPCAGHVMDFVVCYPAK